MKVKKEEFIKLVYSIIQGFGQTGVYAMAFPGIIKYLHDSDEFHEAMEKLDIEDMELDDIKNCKYVTYYDVPNNYVTFEVPKEEAEKIMEKDPKLTVAINNAAVKYFMAVQVDYQSGGVIYFDSDDPDGEYTLPYVCDASDETQSKLYTDGKIVKNELMPDYDQPYRYNREIEVADSTYTIVVDERRKNVTGVAIRGITIGNYQLMAEEALKLQRKLATGYKQETKEKPYVYTLYKN